jgi:hypothetical protein
MSSREGLVPVFLLLVFEEATIVGSGNSGHFFPEILATSPV